MLLRRRGIVAQGAGVPPAPVPDSAAYFQTDVNVGASFPDEQAAYFQTDQNVEE
jgi:hypothetical protein